MLSGFLQQAWSSATLVYDSQTREPSMHYLTHVSY